MTRLGGLSGLVAKGFKGHRHNWKLLERRKYGTLYKFHVCTEHEEPVLKAYDMTIFNYSALQGSSEYSMRQHS
jgi:hypothetical protein